MNKERLLGISFLLLGAVTGPEWAEIYSEEWTRILEEGPCFTGWLLPSRFILRYFIIALIINGGLV